jgi:hypothetical protein
VRKCAEHFRNLNRKKKPKFTSQLEKFASSSTPVYTIQIILNTKPDQFTISLFKFCVLDPVGKPF